MWTHRVTMGDERLRNRILEHFAVHPEAADTAGGIARWWLEDDEDVTLESVERVVLELVESGVVERRRTPDGAVIYGWARRR